MKLILLITFISLHASATIYGQQITISVKDAPLNQVLLSIQKQSGYNFMMQAEDFLKALPVTVNLTNTSIEKTLQAIFEKQPFSYQIDGKFILIKAKETSITEKVKKSLTDVTITGRVTDEQGQPLPGASVKAGGKVAVTNGNGEFSLSGINENSTVEISYIGYKTLNVKASAGYLTISLQSSASDLNEVVINKGYYNIKRELNTGSISSLTAKEIEKQPVNNFINSLEGNVPGLQVTQVSGVPGGEVKVSLRGRNSIANGTNPLYIIDGVPFKLTNFGAAAGSNLSAFPSIRPEDIEQIDVLKDADATAIYGSRGANGVILITTKRGKAGKTKVDANVYKGFGTVANRLDFMNTKEYLLMRKEGLKNDGLTVGDFDYDLNGTWDTTRNVNWQNEMFGRTAQVTNASANLSGGNENTQFLFGLSYRRETTVFPGDYLNNIGSGLLSVNHTSDNKKLNVIINLNYSLNNNKLPDDDFTGNIFQAPDSPPFYNTDGSLNWQASTWVNPLRGTKISRTLNIKNMVANSVMSYNILPGLQLKSSFGYTTNTGRMVALTPFTAYPPEYATDANSFRSNSRGLNDNSSWIIEPQLNYSRSFGGHHLDALIGGTWQSAYGESSTQVRSGYSSDALITNFLAGTNPISNSFDAVQYKYSAVYARLGYNYNEKYILNLTTRRDGSSRFGPGKQFGNFGSIGAAWLFYKEDFVRNNLKFLSFGKLKASMGRTGNDQLPDYSYLSVYNPQGSTTYSGIGILKPFNLSNPHYGWETIDKIEGGLELGFFNNDLQINLNYYRHRTSNQLVGYSLPTTTGFNTVIANLPAVIQNQGFELQASSTNLKGSKIIWTTTANISFPRNKLVEFPNIAGTSYSTQYAVGQPLSIQYSYVYTGIDQQTGQYTFSDMNKDGVITSTLDRVPVFYGTKFSGGISNTLAYKDFSLDFMFQFVKQVGKNGIINGTPGNYNSNQIKDLLNRWISPNQPGKYQKYTADYADSYNANDFYLNSDAVVEDISFVRLRNVMLAYTLPKIVVNTMKIQNLSLYVQGQNLMTITKFKGLDPEGSLLGNVALPPLRLITIGLKASL